LYIISDSVKHTVQTVFVNCVWIRCWEKHDGDGALLHRRSNHGVYLLRRCIDI